MDATPASSSGNTFDAALKALEDLETSVAQGREDKPAAAPVEAAPAPVGTVGLSEDEPAAITAVPVDEVNVPEAESAHEADEEPAAETAAAAEPEAVVQMAATADPLGKFGRLAIWLGLASSVISAAGLIVAERTIVSAQLVVADARERAREFDQSNKLVRELQIVRDKQVELLQQQQALLADHPVSSAELQHQMDSLQAGLMARDPLNQVIKAIDAGQTDNNARFNEFGMKMDRVEAALGSRAQ